MPPGGATACSTWPNGREPSLRRSKRSCSRHPLTTESFINFANMLCIPRTNNSPRRMQVCDWICGVTIPSATTMHNRQEAALPLFELSRVLVRLDHVASVSVNANHRIEKLTSGEKIAALPPPLARTVRVKFEKGCQLLVYSGTSGHDGPWNFQTNGRSDCLNASLRQGLRFAEPLNSQLQ